LFSKDKTAYIFLILATLFWSGNFIVGKAASMYAIPPFSLNFYRWLFAWLILFPFTFKELIKKIGVERRVHTAGKNKSTLDPFLEEKSEDIERLKNIQLDLHKDFIKVVEDSRGSKLNKNAGIELFSGEFWAGAKAKELGLIDGIGNADQILREKFGENVVIKKFEKTKGWLGKKLSSSGDQMDQLVNILEERSIWQRYGF